MALKEIVNIPAPVLRKKCAPVPGITPELITLIEDMFETMYAAPGLGLAAPQVALPMRLFVADTALKEEGHHPNPLAMINPEIVEKSTELSSYEEGCLSIPDYYAEIERPAWVKVVYADPKGATQKLKCEGLLATVVQHEIDHLNGILFIDYLSKLRRDRVIKKFSKKNQL